MCVNRTIVALFVIAAEIVKQTVILCFSIHNCCYKSVSIKLLYISTVYSRAVCFIKKCVDHYWLTVPHEVQFYSLVFM